VDAPLRHARRQRRRRLLQAAEAAAAAGDGAQVRRWRLHGRSRIRIQRRRGLRRRGRPRRAPRGLLLAQRYVRAASIPAQSLSRTRADGLVWAPGARMRSGFGSDFGAEFWVSRWVAELAVRVDAKGGSCSGSAGTDQLPNTPRSKHSATEQRRRSKINDRCVPLSPPVRRGTRFFVSIGSRGPHFQVYCVSEHASKVVTCCI
jgi:hypothetical protein